MGVGWGLGWRREGGLNGAHRQGPASQPRCLRGLAKQVRDPATLGELFWALPIVSGSDHLTLLAVGVGWSLGWRREGGLNRTHRPAVGGRGLAVSGTPGGCQGVRQGCEGVLLMKTQTFDESVRTHDRHFGLHHIAAPTPDMAHADGFGGRGTSAPFSGGCVLVATAAAAAAVAAGHTADERGDLELDLDERNDALTEHESELCRSRAFSFPLVTLRCFEHALRGGSMFASGHAALASSALPHCFPPVASVCCGRRNPPLRRFSWYLSFSGASFRCMPDALSDDRRAVPGTPTHPPCVHF